MLLLLRAVFGISLLVQAALYLRDAGPSAGAWFAGGAALIAGAMLVAGLMTPIAAAAVVAAGIAVGVGWLPPAPGGLFESKPAVIFGATMLAAIIGLGPGAYSIDARLFGRREIIIPPRR